MPIKKNKYLERKRHQLLDQEAFGCTCLKSTAKRNVQTHQEISFDCAENCLNRVVSTECSLGACPTGTACQNRRFQQHQNAYVYPIKTELKGWGLSAGEPIQKSTFIM